MYQSALKNSAKTVGVDQINLTIKKGEFVTIRGKSGSGKTTLLNVIGGVISPKEGHYIFQGEKKEIQQYNNKELTEFRKRHIGYIVQHFALIDDMNVEENIDMPLIYQKISKKEKKIKLNDIMNRLEIADLARKLPYELSGGQKQKVAIARALIHKPEILIADEPTGALDERSGAEIIELLEEMNQQGVTIILVSHDKELAEKGNHLITLRDGRILEDIYTKRDFYEKKK